MINKTKQTDTAKIEIKGKTLELPVLSMGHCNERTQTCKIHVIFAEGRAHIV